MAPPLPKKSMSFHELMEGLGRGHAKIAAQPGAQRLPSDFRQIKPGELPLEVLERYNKQGVFQLPTGEPLTARVSRRISPLESKEQAERAISRGELPKRSSIEFISPKKDVVGEIDIKQKDFGYFQDDPGQMAIYNQLAAEKGRPPRAFGLDTTLMPEGVGREGYAAALDMIRAAGGMNTIDILTAVNQMRRPGNVMSYGLAHGDYRGVPLAPGTKDDPLMFGDPGGGGIERIGAVNEALRRIVGNEAGRETALALDPRGAERYSDEAKTGLLALREMQLAKGYGAPDRSGEYGKGYIFQRAHPMNPADLAVLTREFREKGAGAPNALGVGGSRYAPHRGYGTGLLGRAGTTEALLGGLQYGRTVDDMVEELLSYPGASEAIKGRYAKGGLASALQG